MTKIDPASLRLLLVPGGGGSGPKHWHNFWAADDARCSWVTQIDSTGGTRQDWVRRLDVMARSTDRPTVLVAHSLACVVVAHWAATTQPNSSVIGALLVAPADVEQVAELATTPYNEFVPIPLEPLPFSSVVVASTNDPLLTVARADAFASAWGSDIEYIGDHLHVGSDADLGPWPAGKAILERLLTEIGVISPPPEAGPPLTLT